MNRSVLVSLILALLVFPPPNSAGHPQTCVYTPHVCLGFANVSGKVPLREGDKGSGRYTEYAHERSC